MEFYDGSIKEVSSVEKEKLTKFMKENSNGALATQGENSPRVSIMASLAVSTIDEIYMITDLDSEKIKNIERNSSVEISYFNAENAVIVSGKIEVVEDPNKKYEIYESWFEFYWDKEAFKNNAVVLKFTTGGVRYYSE